MNRTHWLLFALLLWVAGTTSALADSFKSLIVTKADDTTVAVNLSSSMITQLADGDLTITDTGINIRIPLIDVRRWTYSNVAASVSDVHPDAGITLTRSNGDILLSGLPTGAQVELFDLSGRLLQRYPATDGEVRILVSDLPHGTPLLLRAAGQSFKVVLN